MSCLEKMPLHHYQKIRMIGEGEGVEKKIYRLGNI